MFHHSTSIFITTQADKSPSFHIRFSDFRKDQPAPGSVDMHDFTTPVDSV